MCLKSSSNTPEALLTYVIYRSCIESPRNPNNHLPSNASGRHSFLTYLQLYLSYYSILARQHLAVKRMEISLPMRNHNIASLTLRSNSVRLHPYCVKKTYSLDDHPQNTQAKQSAHSYPFENLLLD